MDNELLGAVYSLISRADGGEKISLYECDDFLNNIPKFTGKHGILETKDFLAFLGNPDSNMKIIHVAGTNGKGSVCNYIQCVLIKAGYKVGTFTSPHLVKVTERFSLH